MSQSFVRGDSSLYEERVLPGLDFSKVRFLLFCIEASFVLIPDTSFTSPQTEVIDFIQSSKKANNNVLLIFIQWGWEWEYTERSEKQC